MATRVVAESLRSAGFDVEVDGTSWSMTPRTQWIDRRGTCQDRTLSLDVPGTTVRVLIGDQTRTGHVTFPGIPGRCSIETTDPFSYPVAPGDTVTFAVEVTCSTRADGRLLSNPISEFIAIGDIVIPDDVHVLGGQGTAFVPEIANGDGAYAFLHAGIVGGERRFISASLTFKNDV